MRVGEDSEENNSGCLVKDARRNSVKMRILAKFVNVVFALVLLQQTGLSQPKPPSNQGKTSPDQKQRSRNAGTLPQEFNRSRLTMKVTRTSR
jgi:hypothetical protein